VLLRGNADDLSFRLLRFPRKCVFVKCGDHVEFLAAQSSLSANVVFRVQSTTDLEGQIRAAIVSTAQVRKACDCCISSLQIRVLFLLTRSMSLLSVGVLGNGSVVFAGECEYHPQRPCLSG
jgi:hypothetical protein